MEIKRIATDTRRSRAVVYMSAPIQI